MTNPRPRSGDRVAIPWFTMTSGGLRLEIAQGGWRLSTCASAAAETMPRGGQGNRGGNTAAGSQVRQAGGRGGEEREGDKRWMVTSGIMLRVHGHDSSTGRYWCGTFQGHGSSQAMNQQGMDAGGKTTAVEIEGLGKCEVISISGSIVSREGGGCALEAVMEFALSEAQGAEGSSNGVGAMAWRATLVNAGATSVELDTITLMDGAASVIQARRPANRGDLQGGPAAAASAAVVGGGGRGGGWAGGEGKVELWATIATGVLLLFTVSARGAISLEAFYLGLASLTCASIAAVLVMDMAGLRPSSTANPPWLWSSVKINGWQSFSYAGSISVSKCHGWAGWVWQALYGAGLWCFNPQVGGFPRLFNPITAFSGAFHQGGTPPPAPWWRFIGALRIPEMLRLPVWRQSAPITSDMFALISACPGGGAGSGSSSHPKSTLTVGMLSQRLQFCTVALNPWDSTLAVHASCDGCLMDGGGAGTVKTDWCVARPVDSLAGPNDAMSWYCDAVGVHCSARVPETVPVGWCSWYEHMDNITLKDMTDNAHTLSEARKSAGPVLDIQQLDDGYAKSWGDWWSCNPKCFPGGLEAVAHAARSKGLTPGLWIAPFSCDAWSDVARQHPEWVISSESSWFASNLRRGIPSLVSLQQSYLGRQVLSMMRRLSASNSGFTHPGKWFYGLDVTHPGCR